MQKHASPHRRQQKKKGHMQQIRPSLASSTCIASDFSMLLFQGECLRSKYQALLVFTAHHYRVPIDATRALNIKVVIPDYSSMSLPPLCDHRCGPAG